MPGACSCWWRWYAGIAIATADDDADDDRAASRRSAAARNRAPRPASTRPASASAWSSTSARGGANRFCVAAADIVRSPSLWLWIRQRHGVPGRTREWYRAGRAIRPASPAEGVTEVTPPMTRVSGGGTARAARGARARASRRGVRRRRRRDDDGVGDLVVQALARLAEDQQRVDQRAQAAQQRNAGRQDGDGRRGRRTGARSRRGCRRCARCAGPGSSWPACRRRRAGTRPGSGSTTM